MAPPTISPSPTLSAPPPGVDGSDDAIEEVLEEYPELDVQPWAVAGGDALDTAAAVVAVYLDPASATWWADLSALLSPQAVTVYSLVDPAVIPAGQVTGDPVVLQTAGDGMLATVRVPTSIGDLDVLLTRATAQAGGGWEAEQINPGTT
ncbi:hypothetical protein [Actinotalea sp. K2]|uniref:hypothetical protein n=1 Tax=Actinotalea sp. K2 TaxID=2939438 RepID=UPI002017F41B|nr:hypothetical protein [Actinotalea sp. K2]MCL3863023.1 hypothetical protein [Actinotalea sp. K2]